MDPLDEIKRLYFNTTRATIERDIKRAIDLMKKMKSDEERERARGFMDGLAEMRGEFKSKQRD